MYIYVYKAMALNQLFTPKEVMVGTCFHINYGLPVLHIVPKALVLQECRLKDLLEHSFSAFLLNHMFVLRGKGVYLDLACVGS